MPRLTTRSDQLARPWGALALCGSLFLAPFSQGAETVQSLRYGASLFHFYQQDYFGALTELTAAQKLDALGPHTNGAELLRGGISLSYGMDKQAQRIFSEQLALLDAADADNSASAVDADRAWFFLGKMAWQRGDSGRSLQALGKMQEDYDGPLEHEALYLRASAALAGGDLASARAALHALPPHTRWHHHLSYNVGATFAARGDWAKATPYFQRVSAYDPAAPEDLALRDKSLTAEGYAYLYGEQYAQSTVAFEQVRLQGPYATRALLGFGWASAQQGNYLDALSPWQQLAERSLLDASARESLLAVPYAYNQLARPGIALQKYRLASEQYTRELQDLDSAIAAFRHEPLGPLLGIAEEGSADWLFDTDILPVSEHSPYLQHLITQHGFQVALRELRDLYSIAAHLERARQRLQVLEEVDAHQQATWRELVEENRREILAQRQQQLTEQQAAVRQRLQQAIAQEDGLLLADSRQTVLWNRLEKATQTAAQLSASAQYQDRLRLLRGLLVWEHSEQYPERAWQARRQIEELEALAKQTTVGLQRVDAAIAGRRASDFAPRIASLTQQTSQRSEQVATTIAQSEQQLRQLAVTELERQGEQLRRALGQSQLAIAQLHDQALANSTGSDSYE
ncbi:MAG: hypothetical protein Hals2KO_31470 [Halioglobus sp.]